MGKLNLQFIHNSVLWHNLWLLLLEIDNYITGWQHPLAYIGKNISVSHNERIENQLFINQLLEKVFLRFRV
jgi:hypothetical protein